MRTEGNILIAQKIGKQLQEAIMGDVSACKPFFSYKPFGQGDAPVNVPEQPPSPIIEFPETVTSSADTGEPDEENKLTCAGSVTALQD